MHHGIKVEIMGTALRFYKMGKLIMTATVNGRLGYLDEDTLTQDEVNTAHIAALKTLDLELWHALACSGTVTLVTLASMQSSSSLIKTW